VTVADIDVRGLLRRHNKDATIVAARGVQECMSKGDFEGLRVWKSIEAMLELVREKPGDGKQVN
jgi:hypothetical protein